MPSVSRRWFLRRTVSASALAMLSLSSARPSYVAWAAYPAMRSLENEPPTVLEAIGPRSPFPSLDIVATEQAGFPILGSEILADDDVQIEVDFTAEWTGASPDQGTVGIQLIAGPEPNSPQRPGLILNQRRSDGALVLGHRHGGGVDAVGLGAAPMGTVSCQLTIAADGNVVQVVTPNGSRSLPLSESLYVLGRSLRVYSQAGNAVERISRLRLTKASPPFPEDPMPAGPSLRALASSRGISIGSIINMWRSKYDARYEALMRSLFSHIMVAGGLNWRYLRPDRNSYFFGWADAELNFAAANGQDAIAQHLVWHDSFGAGLPEWLMRGTFSRDEMIAILRDHIATTIDHYRGMVSRWVVVNEAMSPNGFWPRDPYFQRIGQDYVEIAFRAAREADPGVELIYNDNNAIGNKTADQVYALVKRLKDQGLVDGVGMQMHLRIQDALGPDWQPVVPSKDVMLAEMRRYADLGLSVEVTELDINVFGAPISPAEKLQRQAQAYSDVLSAAMESGVCHRLTMFGFVDRFSWLLTRDDLKGTSEAPCILDDDYRPKPAYFALRDVLS